MLKALRKLMPRARDAGEFRYPGLTDGLVVYAVGDIHGCLEPLVRTLAAIEQDKRETRPGQAMTVFLGDYVDRGPDSCAVMERLRVLSDQAGTVLLKGNHDAMLEDFATRRASLSQWLPYGGADTLRSYGASPEAIAADADWLPELIPGGHVDMLARCDYTLRVGGYFFAHAGVRPGVPLEAQSAHDLMWIRDEFLDYRGDLGAVVVHGHTPVARPEFKANRIAIDTGGFMTGQIACLRIDGSGPSVLGQGPTVH